MPVEVSSIVFEVYDGVQAVFPCILTAEGNLDIINGSETLSFIKEGQGSWLYPIFDGQIEGEWADNQGDTIFKGHWIDALRPQPYKVPLFILRKGISYPVNDALPSLQWDFAMGEDVHTGTLLFTRPQTLRAAPAQASILTPTGDYRFLSGSISNNQFKMSTFDGAHLYHFVGELNSVGSMEGTFYSGNHYQQRWSARPVEDLFGVDVPVVMGHDMPPPTIAALGPDGLAMPIDLTSTSHALTILDITATWCPNCLDASRLLHELTADAGDSIRCIYLAFERSAASNPQKAWERINRYSTLIHPEAMWALGGEASKEAASQLLNFLPPITSFPTVVFLPRNGLPEVYSGFHGPATGEAYELQRAVFQDAIIRLSR